MRQRRKEIQSSSSSIPLGSARGEGEDMEPHSKGSSRGRSSPRHPRRGRRPSSHFNDFKVDILEFEGKLDPDDFL